MTYEQFQKQFNIPLNDQQEQAVRVVEGPVLLLAVPGSGKTTVLVTRLGYMVHALGIPPENILTMTYTVAATRDMRGRFARLFGEELAQRMEFRTINGVSARIIRAYEQMEGRRAFRLLADEKELSALVREEMVRLNGEWPTESEVKGVRTAITYAKNQMLTPAEVEAMDKDIPNFSKLYRAYNQALTDRSTMDYDDQMVYARQILRKFPGVLRAFRERYRYLCVDEAQDTSRIQHDIIRLLAQEHGNLFLVGDEDQSIYGFRAACPQALMEFETVWPGARVLLMERNYRSTAPIVSAADAFIRQNENRRDKTMVCTRGEGKPLREVALWDRKKQYPYLAKVARTCGEETAVLYRDNDCALPLIDLLEREGIPYRCREMDGGFFTSRVVQDITDILRLALDPADGEIFLRVYYKLNAGISKGAAERAAARQDGRPILALLAEDNSLAPWSRSRCRGLHTHLTHLKGERGDRAVYRVVHFMGYGEYLEQRGMDPNRAHILEALGEREDSVEGLLTRLGTLQGLVQDKPGDPEAKFILSTIHSSKGLEYERVILMDVLDGVLPKDGENADLEEERRLFYVAMTRAREELTVFTFQSPGSKSQFSAHLFPKKELRKPTPKPATVMKVTPDRPKPTAEELGAYIKGVRVVHRQFGPGEVVERAGELVTVRFASGEEKRLALSIALRAGALKQDE